MTGTNQESFEKLKVKVLVIIVLAMGVVMAGHYFGYLFTEHKSDEVILAELEAQQFQMGGYGMGAEIIDPETGEVTAAPSAEFDNGYSQGFDEGYMQGYNDATMTQEAPQPE